MSPRRLSEKRIKKLALKHFGPSVHTFLQASAESFARAIERATISNVSTNERKEIKMQATNQSPMTFPEPGVDVFVKIPGRDKMLPGRLDRESRTFVMFDTLAGGEPAITRINKRYAERWDYAVPAGDLL